MNVDKYSRTKFFKKNTINGIQEPDLLTNSINNFKFSRQKKFYTITAADVQRPELLCYKLYGKMNYWWILLKINNIEDVWHDFIIGDVLVVPNPKDIEDFVASKK